jgi:hypothetical protein
MIASILSAELMKVNLQIQLGRIEQVGPKYVLVLATRFLLYSGVSGCLLRSHAYLRRFQRHACRFEGSLLINVSDPVRLIARRGDYWITLDQIA